MPDPSRPLDRLKTTTPEGLTWYWVVGTEGAAATWFSEHTKGTLGHSVCAPVTLHFRRAVEHAVNHGQCSFIESECWYRQWPIVTNLDVAARLFDAGDDDGIWEWLEGEYEVALVDAS